jgi:L,D-peptidoglycan transpeptidase YkuD (ErfK/YbiS/YcfS/YnhG family)
LILPIYTQLRALSVPTSGWLRRAASPWLPRAVLLAWILLVLATAAAAAQTERWLLVDSRALTLTVMDGERPQLTLHNLAIGRYGASRAKRRGDNTTPLGRFHITGIERDSQFHPAGLPRRGTRQPGLP